MYKLNIEGTPYSNIRGLVSGKFRKLLLDNVDRLPSYRVGNTRYKFNIQSHEVKQLLEQMEYIDIKSMGDIDQVGTNIIPTISYSIISSFTPTEAKYQQHFIDVYNRQLNG